MPPAASVSSITYASHGAMASESFGSPGAYGHLQTIDSKQPKFQTGNDDAYPTTLNRSHYNYGTTANDGDVQSVSPVVGLSYTQSAKAFAGHLRHATHTLDAGDTRRRKGAYVVALLESAFNLPALSNV